MTPAVYFTLVLLLAQAGDPPAKPPVERTLHPTTMWNCMGAGAQIEASKWLAEHPAYRLLKMRCEAGSRKREST